MEIILKVDIIGLGEEGDICTVADGYARNYLLPKNFAMLKNKNSLKWLERHQDVINEHKKVKSEDAKSLAEKVEGVKVTIAGKVSSADKLYGSIHANQIADALAEKGLEVDFRKIDIPHPIKTVGEHTVRAKLYEGVAPSFIVEVVALDEDGLEAKPAEDSPAATEAGTSTEEVQTATEAGAANEEAAAAESTEADAAAVPAEEAPAENTVAEETDKAEKSDTQAE